MGSGMGGFRRGGAGGGGVRRGVVRTDQGRGDEYQAGFLAAGANPGQTHVAAAPVQAGRCVGAALGRRNGQAIGATDPARAEDVDTFATRAHLGALFEFAAFDEFGTEAEDGGDFDGEFDVPHIRFVFYDRRTRDWGVKKNRRVIRSV